MSGREITFLGDLSRLEMKEGDVLVLHSDQRLSQEAFHRISKLMESRFPGRKILILDAGLKLGVMSGEVTE